MLINHPTDGATRGLTLRVRLLGRNLKKDLEKIILPKKNYADCSLIRSNMRFYDMRVYGTQVRDGR